MWARTAEVMLACWLAMSPFVFAHPADEPRAWWTDLGCAALVAAFSLVSFWPPARRAHLANGAVALALIGSAYLASPTPAPPAVQNHVVVALLLAMLAVVPTAATRPPRGWSALRARRAPS